MNFTNKPESEWNDDDLNTKAAWDSFGADDERKVRCDRCGEYWYEKHYKNGLCHECQKINKDSSKGITFNQFFIVVCIIVLLWMFLS